jgi:hypothetical protein
MKVHVITRGKSRTLPSVIGSRMEYSNCAATSAASGECPCCGATSGSSSSMEKKSSNAGSGKHSQNRPLAAASGHKAECNQSYRTSSIGHTAFGFGLGEYSTASYGCIASSATCRFHPSWPPLSQS